MCRFIAYLSLRDYEGPVAIQLWNNNIGNVDAEGTITPRPQYPLRESFLRKDLIYLVEAHLCGTVDYHLLLWVIHPVYFRQLYLRYALLLIYYFTNMP